MSGPASVAAAGKRKPLVTANQVTFARLALLPFGCALLYAGKTGQWIALVAMTIVGCTDFVDGWLARRYGPTVLGGLMDPIADKLFVALTMLPALDLGWLPTSVVTLIFLREFVITAARTAYSRRNVTLKTSYLAKVKTWYQMIVVGLLFLLEIAHPPDAGRIVWRLDEARLVLAIGFVGAVLGGAIFYAVKRRLWRGSVAFAISFGGIFLVSVGLRDQAFADFIGWITVAITWASGGAYLYGIRDLPGTARFDAHDAVRLFGAIALPLIACPLIGIDHARRVADAATAWDAWPIFTTVALEFAIGGLDNLLAHYKKLGSWAWWGLRVVLQAALLGAALAVAVAGGPPQTIFALSIAALVVTAIAAATLFTLNRRTYLDADHAATAVA